MKYLILLFLTTILFYSCTKNTDYSYSNYSQQIEADSVLDKIVPYMAKLPKKATFETRFNEEYLKYYQGEKASKKYKFDFYHMEADTHYFFCSRIAPSLYQKRMAIVGKLTLNPEKEIDYYEEIFWMFKMPEEELKQKGLLLFTKMLKKEDLSSYYPNPVTTEEWIEFPDKLNKYNKDLRRWVFTPESK
jgi:hypothetical protein